MSGASEDSDHSFRREKKIRTIHLREIQERKKDRTVQVFGLVELVTKMD